MKVILVILVSLLVVVSVVAADLTFTWDANDPAEGVIAYHLYASPTLTGPYSFLGSSPGTNATFACPHPIGFFYVTASNSAGNCCHPVFPLPDIPRHPKSLLSDFSSDAVKHVIRIIATRRAKAPMLK